MKRHIANILTCVRMLCSLCLLTLSPVSGQFWIMYFICGFSDMADGYVARKTGTATAFGSKLDSVADLLFLAAAFVKLMPVVDLPVWTWCWAGGILLIRAYSLVRRIRSQESFAIPHSTMNKLTGLLLFFFPPMTIFVPNSESIAAVICLSATVAAIQDGIKE